MKKILILTYNYVPYNVTGTFRIMRFVKYFPRFGIKPFIVTAEQGNHHMNKNLEKNIPREAEIFRFKSQIPDVQEYNPKVSFLYDEHSNKFKIYAIKLIKYIKDIFFSPDIYIIWCIRILPKLIRLIHKERIKMLMVTGGPFSLFLLGTIIKKITKVKLILDYRDPWQTNPNQLQQTLIRRKLNRLYEVFCLKNADLVIGTTIQIINKIEQYYKGKTLVIPNGIDKDDFREINLSELKKDLFLIGYTGKFDVTSNSYNPTFFLEVFKKFISIHKEKKIKLIVIGDANKKTITYIELISLSNFVIFKGPLPFHEVIKEEAKCNILLHFLYPTKAKDRISIKLLEYLQMQKPILSINTRNSPMEKIINNVKAGFVVENDDEVEILTKLNELYEIDMEKYLRERNDDYLKEYDVGCLTETLAKEIYKIGD
jgi:glycosyltransferase involved in cell wall biosynthesis